MNKPAKKFAEGKHSLIQMKDFKTTVTIMKMKKVTKTNKMPKMMLKSLMLTIKMSK